MTNLPLINEYKFNFILRRIVQTITGGPKILIGLKAPPIFHLIQFVLYFLPWIIGGIFTLTIEHKTALVFGTIIQICFVLFIKIFYIYFTKKQPNLVEPESDYRLKDDEEVNFTDKNFKESLKYIFPDNLPWLTIFTFPLISGAITFCSMEFLSFYNLRATFKYIWVVIILYILGWLVTCNAQFSLIASPPPSPSIFRTQEHYILQTLYRPFYVIIIYTAYFSFKYLEYQLEPLYILYLLLMLGWSLALLPPLEALLWWLAEQLLVFCFGSSPMSTLPWTLGMLLASIVEWLGVGFLLASSLFSSSLYVSSLLGFLLSLSPRGLYQDFRKKKKQWRAVLFYTLMFLLVSLCHWFTTWLSPHVLVPVSTFLVLLSQGMDLLPRLYIGGGLFRNCLLSRCLVDSHQDWPRIIFATLYFTLDKLVGPLFLTFAVGVLSSPLPPVINNWLAGLFLVRAFRQVWQDSQRSLWLLWLSLILSPHLPAPINYIPILLPLVDVAAAKLSAFWHLLFFVLSLGLSSVAYKPQSYSWVLLEVNILFLPVVLAHALVAAILGSPLHPLFTLPVFLLSFPRPTNFWPASPKPSPTSWSNQQDAVYYHMLVPTLTSTLQSALQSGFLGSLSAGTFLLLRLQNRLLLVEILEHSYSHIILVLKGLELQETSCHAVEATKVDDVFGRALSSLKFPYFFLNPDFFCTLTPLQSLPIFAYSDAQSILTGVIDSPSFLEMVLQNFTKVFMWLLLTHFISKEKAFDLPTINKHSRNNKQEPLLPDEDSSKLWAIKVKSAISPTPSWSEDDDPLESFPNKMPKPFSQTYFSHQNEEEEGRKTIPLVSRQNRLSTALSGPIKIHEKKPSILPAQKITGERFNFQYDFSFSETIGPPFEWLQFPSQRILHQHSDKLSFLQLLQLALLTHQDLPKDLLLDTGLQEAYDLLAQACKTAIQPFSGGYFSSSILNQVFQGCLVDSPYKDWLNSFPQLLAILLKAYRYTVKMCLDATFVGEEDLSPAELVKQVEEFDRQWYIGPEGSPVWSEALLSPNITSLFSITYDSDSKTYVSRLISPQPQKLLVGVLNSAVLRGLWTNLAWELVYLTNEDDERYSIQAQPWLLRNLSTQSAPPPLGYPLYTTELQPLSLILSL